MSETKRYVRFIDNYEDVYIKTPTKQKIEIGWEDDVLVDSVDEVVDLLNNQEERIQELEKENNKLKQKIKEETDRVIKLEQYVYTKLCPKSENYNEKVVSAIINTILGDME